MNDLNEYYLKQLERLVERCVQKRLELEYLHRFRTSGRLAREEGAHDRTRSPLEDVEYTLTTRIR